MADKIGDVFIQVTTDAARAAEELRQTVKATESLVEINKRLQNALSEMNQISENTIKKSKRQLNQDLAAVQKRIDGIEKEKKAVEELGALNEAELKKKIKEARKAANIDAVLHAEKIRREAAFLDYAGTSAEQRARDGEKVNKSELKNIQGFLSRAAFEHGRFADRLDRRDMTRSVIENIKRGMQKGLLIGNVYHKDENILQRYARGFGIAGASLDRVKSSAERTANAFYKLQRIGFLLQTFLAALVGSIGALVGGIMGLIGVAGAAIPSLMALGGAVAAVGAGFMVASIAMKGIMGAVSQSTQAQTAYTRALTQARKELKGLKFDAEEAALSELDAALNLERAREELARVQDLPPDNRTRRETELQYQQAELNYRRAKARNQEANKLAAGGVSGIMERNNPGGMNQAMNLLTASQRKFAEYLISIKPKYRELKEAAADAFLGPLQQAVALVTDKMLPTLKNGMTVLGSAMGGAMKTIAKGFTNKENLALLNEFFKDSVPSIKSFGTTMAASFGGMLALLKAAAPITKKFSEWIASSALGFESWAKSGLTDGSLTRFFNLSGEVAAKLGDVFGKVFEGIRNIVAATFPGNNVNAGAGGVILEWLAKIAEGFRMFTAADGFSSWLEKTTTTATVAFSTIGQVLKILLETADRSELKDFFMILRGVVPPLTKIFSDGIAASPAFAKLVVSIARFFAALSDAQAITNFMETLSALVEGMVFILEILKPVIDVFSRFHASILAITAITFLFVKAGMVFFGMLEKISLAVGGVGMAVTRSSAMVSGLKFRFLELKAAKTPIDQIGKSLFAVIRANAAKTNVSFLKQLALDSKVAKAELQALAQVLAGAQRAGITTIGGMRKFVRDSNSDLAKAALEKTRVGGVPQPGGVGRFAAGAVGASLAVGAAQSIASAVGVPMQGAISQIFGAVSMFGAFIPGIPGLIVSGLAGIGSIVFGAIEGAQIKAKAELDQIKLVEANQIKTKEIIDEKTKSIGETLIKSGLSPKKAGEATEKLLQTSRDLSRTSVATGANIGPGQIKTLIAELMSQGGSDVAKTLADPNSRAAQKLIQNAINFAAGSRDARSKPLEANTAAVSEAAAAALSRRGKRGISPFKFNEDGIAVTGSAAAATTDAQNLAFRRIAEDKAIKSAVQKSQTRAKERAADPFTSLINDQAAQNRNTKPLEPIKISPKDNTVKLAEAKELKEATLSTALNIIKFFTANPINEIANYYIDGKTVSKDEFKKTGLSP